MMATGKTLLVASVLFVVCYSFSKVLGHLMDFGVMPIALGIRVIDTIGIIILGLGIGTIISMVTGGLLG